MFSDDTNTFFSLQNILLTIFKLLLVEDFYTYCFESMMELYLVFTEDNFHITEKCALCEVVSDTCEFNCYYRRMLTCLAVILRTSL